MTSSTPAPACPNCYGPEWIPGGSCFVCGWEGSSAEAYSKVLRDLHKARRGSVVHSKRQYEEDREMRLKELDNDRKRLLAEVQHELVWAENARNVLEELGARADDYEEHPLCDLIKKTLDGLGI